MTEYEKELIKEIKSEAESMGDKAARILCLCDILLQVEDKPSEISPESKLPITI